MVLDACVSFKVFTKLGKSDKKDWVGRRCILKKIG
jgi:hypothetical protein